MENNENMFNTILQTKVDEDKKQLEKERLLKKEFGIDENKTVGIKIEKENIISTIFKIINKLISKLAFIIIIIFAFIGLVSVLHPDSKEIMFKILTNTLHELNLFY